MSWRWLILLGLLLLLAAPGCWLTARRPRPGGVTGWWGQGATLGLALAVIAIYLCSYVATWWFWPTWGLVLLATAAWWWRGRTPAKPLTTGTGAAAAAIILGLVGLSRLLPIPAHEVPPGFDPSFHLLLVQKALLAGRLVTDWEPFSHATLNYPLGSHLLVAALTSATGLPPAQVFMLLFPVAAVLTTAQVWLLARRVADQRVALLAAFAYGFLAVYGSVSYFAWGGLPNALGMVFFLANLNLLLADRFGGREQVEFSVLFTASCLIHHHVMLTSGVVYGVLLLYLAARRTARERAWGLLRGLVGTLVLGGFYLLPYALRVTKLGQTDVLRYQELLFTPGVIVRSLGYAFAVCVVAGLGVLAWRRRWLADRGIVGVALLALLGCFIAGEYGWRYYARWRWGQDWTAFTPSRFLTDMMPLLALPAGVALAAVGERFRLPSAAGWVLLAGLAASVWPEWRPQFRAAVDPGLLRALAYVRAQSPAETIVLANEVWVCSTAWRRCICVPLPITEGQAATPSLSVELREMVAGRRPWRDDYYVVAVGPRSLFRPEFPVLWTDESGWAVVEVRKPASAATP